MVSHKYKSWTLKREAEMDPQQAAAQYATHPAVGIVSAYFG